jgi:hypothetical protein
MPPDHRLSMIYLLAFIFEYSKPSPIAKVCKYKMVFTYGMIQARCRVPFCAWWNSAGTSRRGEKALLHLSSPPPPPLSSLSLQCRCRRFIMIITRRHARRPRRVRSIYNLPSATSASATCTSISDFASPAHARCHWQLQAQVELYELTIQPPMQTSGSGKY